MPLHPSPTPSYPSFCTHHEKVTSAIVVLGGKQRQGQRKGGGAVELQVLQLLGRGEDTAQVID